MTKNSKKNKDLSNYFVYGAIFTLIGLCIPFVIYIRPGITFMFLLTWFFGFQFRIKVWSYYTGFELFDEIGILGILFTSILIIFSVFSIKYAFFSPERRDDSDEIKPGLIWLFNGILNILFSVFWLYALQISFSTRSKFMNRGLSLGQNLFPFVGFFLLIIGGLCFLFGFFKLENKKEIYNKIRQNTWIFVLSAGLLATTSLFTPAFIFQFRGYEISPIPIIREYDVYLWLSDVNIILAILLFIFGVVTIRYAYKLRNQESNNAKKIWNNISIVGAIMFGVVVMWTFFFYLNIGYRYLTSIYSLTPWLFFAPGFGIIGPLIAFVLIIIAKKIKIIEIN